MRTHPRGLLNQLFFQLACLAGPLISSHFPAHAETRLTGKADAIRLEARDASIEEVFTSLGATYGLRFRSTTPLGERITGTFEGSLSQVVAGVLRRYNYVVKNTAGTVEVAVFGSHHGTVPVPSALPSAPQQQFGMRDSTLSARPSAPAPLDWELRTNVANPGRRPKQAQP